MMTAENSSANANRRNRKSAVSSGKVPEAADSLREEPECLQWTEPVTGGRGEVAKFFWGYPLAENPLFSSTPILEALNRHNR